MKFLKNLFFHVCFFSLVFGIMSQAFASTEIVTGQTENQSSHIFAGADLEATITLAELQEILMKINEDLSERIYQLEYSDSQELVTILNERRQAVIRQLKELQGFDEESVALYLLHSRKKKDLTLFFWIGGAAAGVAMGALVMASVDPRAGLRWPTLGRLRSNFDGIINGCKSMVTEIVSNLIPKGQQ